MKVTWESAKELSTFALGELVLKAVHAMGQYDPDVYAEGVAALCELRQRAVRGEVWRDELERRRNAA